MRKRVTDILIELGIPANLKGFYYIADTMEIYAADESFLTGKRMLLYRKIAFEHNTTDSRVERCIRSAFHTAVTYGNLDSLNKYMTAAQRVTNGNMLACLYLKIKDLDNKKVLKPVSNSGQK